MSVALSVAIWAASRDAQRRSHCSGIVRFRVPLIIRLVHRYSPRGEINDDYANCTLNLTGLTGSAGDMWITVVDGAEGGPSLACVELKAQVLIKKFNNRKAVGFVTHYNLGTQKGLFLGLYDNGNSDAMTLSTFDADWHARATVANSSRIEDPGKRVVPA